jgi:PDZ domain-containing protein
MSLATRRRAWVSGAGIVGIALMAYAVLLPVPFIELAPGPTFNTLGESDGTPIISIHRAETYPTSGHLDLTTVNERGGPGNGLYIGRAIVGWADPRVRIVPREAFYPDEVSRTDVEAENAQMFNDSESDSIAAALTYLHKPVFEVVVVSSVIDGGPSDGRLAPGDQIAAINGNPVKTVEDVGTQMGTVTPGDNVAVRVVHQDGGTSVAQVTTTSLPKDPARAYLGITVGTTLRGTFPISVTLGGVGGPSAGTMLSLGIIDKLTPGELTGGRFVAGTGTITPDGTVGPIGGIAQKMVGAANSGATLFLAPDSNCADVRAARVPSGLTIARISTLADAVKAIEAYVAGTPVTGCG